MAEPTAKHPFGNDHAFAARVARAVLRTVSCIRINGAVDVEAVCEASRLQTIGGLSSEDENRLLGILYSHGLHGAARHAVYERRRAAWVWLARLVGR